MRLPLFPLPLVLFPGAPLPLHVFEPRYRRMLADCLAGDRRFGIIYLPEKADEHEIARGRIGCVARVEQAEELEDGRANIAVVGVERFAMVRFADSEAPYHVADVELVRDETEPPEPELEARVRAAFDRVARAARALADDPSPPPPLPDDAALLSFSIASIIDVGADARQRLLASRSPADRLRQLDAVLSPAVESVEARASVHRRARSNGHGPASPDA